MSKWRKKEVEELPPVTAPPVDDTVAPIMTAEELEELLSNPMERICSGKLYKIIVKKEEGDAGKVLYFVPNRAQRRFLSRLHHRNIILKARQLGFTTLICIVWLDHALFNDNQRCAIIAQDLLAAQAIFRDKIKFAYDNLPSALRDAMPLASDSKTELLFEHNNSSVRVATSVRSGTVDRLHVSEFGKICAHNPGKANEVVTGSLPAVPSDGIAVIESTAEGQGGEFHSMCKKAKAHDDQGKKLTSKDWRFHFFPWWQEPHYAMDPEGVIMTKEHHEYFDKIEEEMRCRISMQQRAWYVATLSADYSDAEEKMWQEYPSTPDEAFKQSTVGCYYVNQMTAARKQGRICNVPYTPGIPVNTFWDIGSTDGTAIWFHQRVGLQDRFIDFVEAWGEGYSYFVKEMQDRPYVYGRAYLPHDAAQKRQQTHKIASPEEMLIEAGLKNTEIVPVVDQVINGIQLVRDHFPHYWFDEEKCLAGIAHLDNYKKKWSKQLEVFYAEPLHDKHSEAADAIRQHAQGYAAASTAGTILNRNATKRSWRAA